MERATCRVEGHRESEPAPGRGEVSFAHHTKVMEIEKKTVHSRGIAVFTGLDPLRIQGATACSGRVGSASWIGAIRSGTVLAVCSPSAWAAEPTPGAEVQAGATKAKESEPSPESGPTHLMEGISQWRQRASARGFDFNVQYLGEVIGNLSGGVRRSAVYQGLLKAGFDLDGEKIVGWKGSILHISGLYAHGRSPSGRLAGDSLAGSIEDSTATILSRARATNFVDPKAAIELYTQVLEVDPDNVEALTYRAWLLVLIARSAGDEVRQLAFASASSDLERAIALDPDYADAHCFLGITRFRLGDDASGAKEQLTICAAKNPPAEVKSFVDSIVAEVDAALDK